ncbi:TPR-like protein [Rozella allomycis CSF55]|uniref:Anaphase-promoting complex subunit 11 n=1 Tax=Rozella allomycis (strain CSF55) TaxID=988480 RepID=A0A075AWQ0_ROZAC|nr:Anaphase-promoting complex subunit 11 domain-containing protein [Rozella allomycis CSF55]RKP22059.1 TPR-like protein [Rozella allomycis CSF55]|eukprot:EPZ34667.1 Anaphase-promoting complex subunit 11 domain-containing protein [Rozella allomycis CSF55]
MDGHNNLSGRHEVGVVIGWKTAAIWKWNVEDDVCGICRAPFEGCCPECKIPGDDCSLSKMVVVYFIVWGACKHCFHLHCLMTWLQSQNEKQQCPMCRQEWQCLMAVLRMEESIPVKHVAPEDVPYEEELVRNPFYVKGWLRYIQHKREYSYEAQCYVYERALLHLPRSYKIWKQYLNLRTTRVQTKWILDREYEVINMCFERALMHLNKMPRIWLDYVEFLIKQRKVTLTRRVLDRALRALPVTQHERIWKVYLQFVVRINLPELSVRVYRRYLQLFPEKTEEYIKYLRENECYDLCAQKIVDVINNENFVSVEGKTHYMFWVELCEMICEHPKEMKGIKVDAILRSGIQRFQDQRGKLWTSLADYYIYMGQFDKARDVYEEGIHTVMTVRDFTQIFEAYTKFEETLLSGMMEKVGEEEIDLRLGYFERLMKRRSILLNDVMLRQNPNNVHEWLKRTDLFKENERMLIETFENAVRTVNSKQAVGKYSELWIEYALYFERKGDIEEASRVYERAIEEEYKTVNSLAEVWISYSNLSIEIMARAVRPTKGYKVDYHDEMIEPKHRLFKCLKLWNHYVDLEEAFGTFETTRAVYERILDLKIANLQTIINYGLFLETNEHFEESFKIYERGIDLFGYPMAFEIWNIYLAKFIKRYSGTKLERARDLFEQALDKCPPKYSKNIYLMYAKLEEDFGIIRHALRIYDRATKNVAKEDKLQIFKVYITKIAQSYGLTFTREIYEKAIQNLNDSDAKIICLEYAEMEKKLGEIDRARALYSYAAQFCDPKTNPEFWNVWNDFEVKHGNEDTFREMLRVKRSVQALFNTQLESIAAQHVKEAKDAMESLEINVDEETNQIDNQTADDQIESIDNVEIQNNEIDDQEELNDKVEIEALPEQVLKVVATEEEEQIVIGAKARFMKK